MIEVILLIVGISYVLKRPKLKRLTLTDFPQLEQEKFSAWQTAELKAVDIFLWATWGAFVIKLAVQLILMAIISKVTGEISEGAMFGIIAAVMVLWLIGLAIAGVYGSKAQKLRVAYGIKWPK
jgi:hypothetical protein